MKPEDKFGKKIYQQTFQQMLHFGSILLRNGYSESKNKPNLFYRAESQDLVFFADMRGTDTIHIWEDPTPLLYVNFPESMPQWKRKRLIQKEHAILGIGRFSFFDECEPEGLMFGEGGDGYCIVCHKDFSDEGLFCSDQCKNVACPQ